MKSENDYNERLEELRTESEKMKEK